MEVPDEQLVGVMLLLSESFPEPEMPVQGCTPVDSLPTNGTIYAIEDQVLFSVPSHYEIPALEATQVEEVTQVGEESVSSLHSSVNSPEQCQLDATRVEERVLPPLLPKQLDFGYQFVPEGMTMRPPRWPNDLYTPRWVRGHQDQREGLCCLCNPPVWLRIKQSSYWYHLNFYHGISAKTGRPWADPQEQRISGEGKRMVKCGQCSEWITVECTMTPWYRHAQKCHHL